MGLLNAFRAVREVYRDLRDVARIAKAATRGLGSGLRTLGDILNLLSGGHFVSLLTKLLVRAPIPKSYLKTTNRHHSRLFKRKSTPATIPVTPHIIDNYTELPEPSLVIPPIDATTGDWEDAWEASMESTPSQSGWSSPTSTASWLSPITPSSPAIQTDHTLAAYPTANWITGQEMEDKLNEAAAAAAVCLAKVREGEGEAVKVFGASTRWPAERRSNVVRLRSVFEPEPKCLPSLAQVLQDCVV